MLAIMGVVIVGRVGKGGASAIGANKGIGRGGTIGIEANVVRNMESSESDVSDSSDSMSILAGSYFLLYIFLIFILFMSLAALMTQKLLA